MALDLLILEREFVVVGQFFTSFNVTPAIDVDVLGVVDRYDPGVTVRTTRVVDEAGEVALVGCINYLRSSYGVYNESLQHHHRF